MSNRGRVGRARFLNLDGLRNGADRHRQNLPLVTTTLLTASPLSLSTSSLPPSGPMHCVVALSHRSYPNCGLICCWKPIPAMSNCRTPQCSRAVLLPASANVEPLQPHPRAICCSEIHPRDARSMIAAPSVGGISRPARSRTRPRDQGDHHKEALYLHQRKPSRLPIWQQAFPPTADAVVTVIRATGRENSRPSRSILLFSRRRLQAVQIVHGTLRMRSCLEDRPFVIGEQG